MDFSLSKEQLEICRAVRDLSRKGLNDGVFADDENAVFPRHKWDLCRSFGFQGLPIDPAYGGAGQDMLTSVSWILHMVLLEIFMVHLQIDLDPV